MIREFFSLFYSDAFLLFLQILVVTMPVWLPILLALTFWNLWIRYKRKQFILSQEMVLLEVFLPVDIKRSPKAMEAVFSAIHTGPQETTWYSRLIQGKVRPWWSFEIVSIEGHVHFYIWTRAFFRNTVESAIYGQYPEVEIHEAKNDYARLVTLVPEKTKMWGCDFGLDEPDAYPIKTYVDYGLDREGIKDEEKVDPMASFLEFFASIRKGEQLWIQIIIQQTKSTDMVNKGFPNWKKEAAKEVEKLRAESLPKDPEARFAIEPSEGTKMKIAAIERSINKHGFNAGIRGLYFADASVFNPANIPGLITSLKHYSSNNLNGFFPQRTTDFNYPWQDYNQIRETWNGRRLLEAYRKRPWFHPPYRYKPYVLNTEELATIYHFPGSVVQTPGLQRIPSKRSDAPPNLPI